MATFKNGFNDKPCEIRVSFQYGSFHIDTAHDGQTQCECLHYATVEEVAALAKECKRALESYVESL
jgi:hypothetical protein